ncbi:MAG TPA: permease, partial [Alphaproteobacteria bacterium]
GIIAANPHRVDMPENFSLRADAKARLKNFKFTPRFLTGVVADGLHEGRMVMRWLFFGTILAALIRTFVSTDMMTTYFGPTLLGLLLTLAATTVIEVCSEGSAPIGAELVTRAAAPGNGFAFLMAGVSTDYTEILVLRQITGSWKSALFLPLLTMPQILLLGWIMNQMAVN